METLGGGGKGLEKTGSIRLMYSRTLLAYNVDPLNQNVSR